MIRRLFGLIVAGILALGLVPTASAQSQPILVYPFAVSSPQDLNSYFDANYDYATNANVTNVQLDYMLPSGATNVSVNTLNGSPLSCSLLSDRVRCTAGFIPDNTFERVYISYRFTSGVVCPGNAHYINYRAYVGSMLFQYNSSQQVVCTNKEYTSTQDGIIQNANPGITITTRGPNQPSLVVGQNYTFKFTATHNFSAGLRRPTLTFIFLGNSFKVGSITAVESLPFSFTYTESTNCCQVITQGTPNPNNTTTFWPANTPITFVVVGKYISQPVYPSATMSASVFSRDNGNTRDVVNNQSSISYSW